MSISILSRAKKEFLDNLLIDYIETHTSAERCDICGAYREDHRFKDCNVKIAVELREQLT